MKNGVMLFLLLAILCVILEGFFSMFEMASVSFNKVRLQYYVSKKKKRAVWLHYLLQKPSRLFGTTLIVVNTVLLIGSEAARRFYESMHLNPDYAPITQVIIVVLFGELTPLFAARRYPEHVALFNVPIVYAISKILFPFTWLIDKLSSFIYHLFGKEEKSQIFLTKEEIQRAFEEKTFQVDKTISNIFSLKNLTAQEIMVPLWLLKMMPSTSTLEQLKKAFQMEDAPYFLIYHHNMHNIVSVAMPRDLLKVTAKERIIEYGKSPWFVVESSSILEILKQFRQNNQSVAIILNKLGKAVGVLTLDHIMDQIFETEIKKSSMKRKKVFIEKTLPGEMLVADFNKKFQANLTYIKGQTLSDLINEMLEHHPSTGEIVHIENFEFIIQEPALFGTKTMLVRNLK